MASKLAPRVPGVWLDCRCSAFLIRHHYSRSASPDEANGSHVRKRKREKDAERLFKELVALRRL